MKPRVLLTSFPAFGQHDVNVSMKVMEAIESIGITGIKLGQVLEPIQVTYLTHQEHGGQVILY